MGILFLVIQCLVALCPMISNEKWRVRVSSVLNSCRYLVLIWVYLASPEHFTMFMV